MANKAEPKVASPESRLDKIEADLRALKAMVGFNVALTIAVFVKLFVR